MKKFTYLFIGLLSASLVACQGNNNQNTNIDLNANSVFEAIETLAKLDNYSIDVKDTILGDEGTVYFTSNSYYNSLYEYGYIESEDGVYQVSFSSKEEGLASELIKKEDGTIAKKIFNDHVVYTFKDFDSSLIEDDSTNIDIKSNKLRMAFLNIVDQDENIVNDVVSFNVSLDGATVEDLTFKMTFKDSSYIEASISNVFLTNIAELDTYVANGGTYFTPDEDWVRIRELFKKDNYIRNIYSYNADNSADLIGTEIYDEKYFATLYDCKKDPMNAMYLDAYFGANNNELTVNYTDGATQKGTLKGIYKSWVNYDQKNDSYEIQPIVSQPIVDSMTSIPQALNYPKHLSMFSNYQYYSLDEEINEYYSDNAVLALSMYINFNLGQIYGDYDVNLIGSSFSYNMAEKDEDCVVTLKLYLTVNGTFVYQDFEFTDFGVASFKPLEDLTTSWVYNAPWPLNK